MTKLDSVFLVDVLQRLRDEITRVQSSVLKVEDLLISSTRAQYKSENLQELDIIVQSLEALSNLVENISLETSNNICVSREKVLCGIKLEAISQRVSGLIEESSTQRRTGVHFF